MAAKSLDDYIAELTRMRERLVHHIGDERDAAREALESPAEDGILHTHNADMDTEGIDAAVGVTRSLQDELVRVDQTIRALQGRDPDSPFKDDAERARVELMIDTQDWAERMEKRFGVHEEEE